MKIEIKNVLYLSYVSRRDVLVGCPKNVSDDFWVEQNRPLCKVEGCGHHGERKYDGGFYILCFSHRKLAKDIFNGVVPKDYVPSSIIPGIQDYPICSIPGCTGRCHRTYNVLGELKFTRYCNFHKKTKNRVKMPEVGKDYSPVDYSLPMPDPEYPVEVNLPVCEVEGCGKPVHYTIDKNRLKPVYMYNRCRVHRRLKLLGKPDNYVQKPSERLLRGKCIVEGCDKLQANKGLVNGVPRYDLYCEKHRRGRFKVEKKPRVKQDKTKCSVCGWKGPCDSHRILRGAEGGKYTAGNVVIICPNCHRLAHSGLLIL